MTLKMHDVQNLLLHIITVWAQPNSCVYILSMAIFPTTMTEPRICDRGHMVCKAENVNFLTLHRKCVSLRLAQVYVIPFFKKFIY